MKNCKVVFTVSDKHNRTTAIGTCTKVGEVRLCIVDRQTDKQTHSSQYFAPLPGAKY